jgi:hypothetical protein
VFHVEHANYQTPRELVQGNKGGGVVHIQEVPMSTSQTTGIEAGLAQFDKVIAARREQIEGRQRRLEAFDERVRPSFQPLIEFLVALQDRGVTRPQDGEALSYHYETAPADNGTRAYAQVRIGFGDLHGSRGSEWTVQAAAGIDETPTAYRFRSGSGEWNGPHLWETVETYMLPWLGTVIANQAVLARLNAPR